MTRWAFSLEDTARLRTICTVRIPSRIYAQVKRTIAQD
jgi:hypothetical protein